VTQSDSSLSVVGSPDDASTVIAPGTHVAGRISGQEDIRVHGTVEGRIHLAATLFVEPEGVVAAEVHAHDVVVSGTVVGNITASGSVVLAPSARVVGDLRTPRLVVAPGAAFRGQVSMDPLDDDELDTGAEAGRSEGRRDRVQQAASQYTRPAGRPANGARLPPPRVANTARRDAAIVKHPAVRTRLEEHASEAYSEVDETDWGDGKRAKKVARPRLLARGKHKVERL
jgi:cytoskeletal protein CcmA (bactofilin family)